METLKGKSQISTMIELLRWTFNINKKYSKI